MKGRRQIRFALPLLVFFLIIALLWRGLALHPSEIPSPFINKNIPQIDLPSLYNPGQHLTNKDFLGHVSLLNVWATWCTACADEHELLIELAKNENIIFYGLNYKDDPALAKQFLNQNGNPYKLVGVDVDGKAAIDWGVYGTPETFVIDKKGIVRYKQIGAISENLWETKLKPLIQQLETETP